MYIIIIIIIYKLPPLKYYDWGRRDAGQTLFLFNCKIDSKLIYSPTI